jgi:hypothetical protein
LLKVAECQKAKLSSTTWASRTGFTGSEMSSRMPLPEQAPAAMPISGYTVMSWHWRVSRELCVPGPWSPPCQRSEMSPLSGSAKMRGRLTMRASCGEARGTWMTSMPNSAVSGSSSLAGGLLVVVRAGAIAAAEGRRSDRRRR